MLQMATVMLQLFFMWSFLLESFQIRYLFFTTRKKWLNIKHIFVLYYCRADYYVISVSMPRNIFTVLKIKT